MIVAPLGYLFKATNLQDPKHLPRFRYYSNYTKWLGLRRGILFSQYHEKKGKRKVQGVPQSQTAAFSRPQEEEETDESKQAQIEQTYEKH